MARLLFEIKQGYNFIPKLYWEYNSFSEVVVFADCFKLQQLLLCYVEKAELLEHLYIEDLT